MEALKKNGKYSPVKLIGAITALLAVLSGSGLAWYKAIAGEPEANEVRDTSDKAYKDIHKTLAQLKAKYEDIEKVQNRQSKALDQQTKRMILYSGISSGVNTGRLMEKHEALQKKYDKLFARRVGHRHKPIVEILRGELVEERRLRKAAEAKSVMGRGASPTIQRTPKITLPPASPFKKRKSK
jgi:NADH dehydrogenase/NADH:ubiquinone oxidoreductase subunit G